MGTAWWTGRDLTPPAADSAFEPTPAVFRVRNIGDEPLYFESTMLLPVRFDLLQRYCGRLQKLELPENHFCPTLCPDEGPAQERDCGRPPRIMQRLPPGEDTAVGWSGTEQVGLRRMCDGPPGQFCLVNRVTVPGTYTLEVCAFTGVAGGRPDPNDPNRLMDATPAGIHLCRRIEFRYPTRRPVEIQFGG